MGIAGNLGRRSHVGDAFAGGIYAFKAGLAYVAATAAVGRIALRIDNHVVANHLTLPLDALVVLANKSVSTSGARCAVPHCVELYFLIAAIGGAWGYDTFTINTCQAVVASVIARAAMIEVGFSIAGDTVAVGVSEASAVYAIKAIGTSIATGAAIIDIGLNIGVHTVAISRRYG